MLDAPAARLAVARLSEAGVSASRYRHNPDRPLEGYCLLTGDERHCRVTIYLENGRTLTDRSPDGAFYYEGWILSDPVPVSVGAFNTGAAGEGSGTCIREAGLLGLAAAKGIRITAEPLGGSLYGAEPVLEGSLIWLHGRPQSQLDSKTLPAADSKADAQVLQSVAAGITQDVGAMFSGATDVPVPSASEPLGADVRVATEPLLVDEEATPPEDATGTSAVTPVTAATPLPGPASVMETTPEAGPAPAMVTTSEAGPAPAVETTPEAGPAPVMETTPEAGPAAIVPACLAVDASPAQDVPVARSTAESTPGSSTAQGVDDPPGEVRAASVRPSLTPLPPDTPTPFPAPTGTSADSASPLPPEPIAITVRRIPITLNVPLQSRHPMAPRAGGTAVLHLREGRVAVTLRGLPSPAAMGRVPGLDRPFNAYRLWLVNRRSGSRHPLGPLTRVWGENFRGEGGPGIPLSHYDTLLVTADDRSASNPDPHWPQVIVGSFEPTAAE